MPTRRKTFKVEGKELFPMDMLRFDMYGPVGPEDVTALHGDLRRGRREVKLGTAAAAASAPTKERWASFLWTVV